MTSTHPPVLRPTAPSAAIVVPARNEEDRIAASLLRLRLAFPTAELVVVDGSSTDNTAAVAAELAPVLTCAPGRARQMNLGAEATDAEVLWFVHADVTVDPGALGQIRAALSDPRVVGGGLSLRFDRRSPGLDYLAWSSNQRARRLGLVFGDQAMFVRRRAFDELGGFPEIAVMEDLELSRRLKRLGRLVVVRATSTASARRFEAHGTWSMIAYMQYLKALYFAGADPVEIERRYRSGPPWRRRAAAAAS
ncbi:MAG: TIGR04283 family arsenosugar biosynthesis glycosyltransferase [Actinomycetota bacterium]|nr:TIGR04283 family arsenosugar biosynthesis glycosyltransferase [Actinomycetota bacterium]